MMSKKAIRIIAIFLAALMFLSAGAVLLQVFAIDASAIAANVPQTGDNDLDYIVPIAILALAIVAVCVCVIMPKLKKKSDEPNEDDTDKE